MDIVKIQALIAQGRVVKITDIDPTNSFVQIGVYQPDNRKIGSANNTYPPFVIPLSELGGSNGGTNSLNATIDLNTIDEQFIIVPKGTYIIDKVYLSGASIDLSTTSVYQLKLLSGINLLLQSTEPPPCPPPSGICGDGLAYLFTPQNYVTLITDSAPGCWTPPCNGATTYTEGDVLIVKLTTASGVPATVNINIIVDKIT
jgi:hypothetical protein